MSKNTGRFVVTLLVLAVLAVVLVNIDFNEFFADTSETTSTITNETEAVIQTSTEVVVPSTAIPSLLPLILFSTEAVGEVNLEAAFLEVETVGNCNLTVLQAVALAKKVAREEGIPWSKFGPLILSESSFHQWVPDKTGKCQIHTSKDDKGNPIAYGLAQVYAKVHTEFSLEECLIDDPLCNLKAGAKILKDKFSRFGSWDKAAAAYKGISPNPGFEGDSAFKGYKTARDKGEFTDLASKTLVSFADTP